MPRGSSGTPPSFSKTLRSYSGMPRRSSVTLPGSVEGRTDSAKMWTGALKRRRYFFPFSSGSRSPEYCTSISSTTTSSLAIASKIR
jgi:hypothetical protein